MTRFAKESRVIFDLGMNNGDDTDYYLRRGFYVVALEANPSLCEAAEKRFRKAIADESLKILNAAIWDSVGEATFYLNLDNDHWSSLDVGWARRHQSRVREILVKCVTLANLFEKYGVPIYLKIDVEGVDQNILQQLLGKGSLPLYVSVEDCRFGFEFIETLAACGYDGFKLLDQSTVPAMADPANGHSFPPGSSGPFGSDLPGSWLSHSEIVTLYSTTVRDLAGNRLAPRTRWWDIHCTHLASA